MQPRIDGCKRIVRNMDRCSQPNHGDSILNTCQGAETVDRLAVPSANLLLPPGPQHSSFCKGIPQRKRVVF